MSTVNGDLPAAHSPWWIRRPGIVHAIAYGAAGAVFLAQLVAVLVVRAELLTFLAVLVAGLGVALSWTKPWAGLVVTSAASFAVTAVGRDPLSVWMMAVLVLFSVAFRGRRAVFGTAMVAVFFLATYMTVGGFQGGVVGGTAALFSAISGGAAGAALRLYREQWLALWERARAANVTREIEADRRVVEERLRIARDLHDVVGHQVAMLSVHLGVAELGLPQDAESSREALLSARGSARSVVVETQKILALLRRGDAATNDESLRPTPSVDDLDALIESFVSIGLDVHSSIDLPVSVTGSSVGVTVYRVLQEALTNAYRHGNGVARVSAGTEDGRVVVTVSNDVDYPDRGPKETSLRGGGGVGGGLALVGMRERVEASGGFLIIERTDGRFLLRADAGPVAVVLA